jgi:membrane dipeptidase
MHCDTATKLYDNNINLDLETIAHTQFFAVFLSPEYYKNSQKRCFDVINYMYNEFLNKSEKIKLCRSFKDLNSKKTNAFLTIEGGEAISSIADLKTFYDLGIRLLTLTWNNDNHIGGANGSLMGLTDFGKKLIPAMNEIGMIIDLSHSSEKTFFDACEISKKPVVLSHSNSYSLCPHQRNITDKQCNEIKRLGGFVGINFYPPFLTQKKSANIYDIISHIEYFLSLDGENNIGIGSDLDGIDTIADGIKTIKDTDKIFNILSSRGISDEIIKKIAYKNIYRVLSICL